MQLYRTERPLTSSEFRDGPTRYRRPTDWICALLFLGMWVAVAVVGTICGSTATKDIDRPRDYDHNTCDDDYPLLYVASFDTRRTVCVRDCPEEIGSTIRCKKNSMFRYCPVSRGALVRNNFFRLCHTEGTNIQMHTVKGNASSFAGSIIEAVDQISKTAGVITAAGLFMTLLTLCFPAVTIWVWIAVLEVGLCLLGGLFMFMFVEGRMPYCPATTTEEKHTTFVVLAVGCFVAAVVVLVFCMFRGHIYRLRTVLILARACLRTHWYVVVLAIALSALSLAMMALLAKLLELTQSNVRLNYLNRAAYDQFVMAKEESVGLIVLLAAVYLWSHGFMVALSSFIGEAFAVHWYFNRKQRQAGMLVSQLTFFQVLKEVGVHFGTICYHGAAALLPGFAVRAVASIAPCWNSVSIYGLFQTVLCGQHFKLANQECWHLRNRVKARLQHTYLLGLFYVRVAKGLVWVLAMLVASAFMAQANPYFFGHSLYVVPPLLVTTLMAVEVGTHFSVLLGIIGDTIVISYGADLEMSHERTDGVPELVLALLSPFQPIVV